MVDRTIPSAAWSPVSMPGMTEEVRSQQGGILALSGRSWRAQSGVHRVSSFLTSGVETSGGKVSRVEARGFRSAEAGLPNPGGGLSRPTPLWSVLRGQAGCEEELRTEHVPSQGPAGGPGQVRLHVGPLNAFCSVSGLVLSFPVYLQRGGSKPCQGGKVSTTRAP